MKKRCSDEQIVGFLRESESGVCLKDLCRLHGFSERLFTRSTTMARNSRRLPRFAPAAAVVDRRDTWRCDPKFASMGHKY